MKPVRVFLFSTVYFLLFASYFAYLATRTLAIAEPDALIWYFRGYPLDRLVAVFLLWHVHAPMMTIGLIQMVILATVLGFVTDWGIQFITRLVRLVARM